MEKAIDLFFHGHMFLFLSHGKVALSESLFTNPKSNIVVWKNASHKK